MNCNIYNSEANGLCMHETNAFEIKDCHIYDNTCNGIIAFNFMADSNPMSIINRCETNGNGDAGISTIRSKYGVFGNISYCNVHHNEEFGILISTKNPGAMGAIIEYNESHHNSIKEEVDNPMKTS